MWLTVVRFGCLQPIRAPPTSASSFYLCLCLALSLPRRFPFAAIIASRSAHRSVVAIATPKYVTHLFWIKIAAAAAMAVEAATEPLAAGTVSSPALVRVIDTVLVPPPPGPWDEENSLPLTFFDIFWLHSPPVERVFLYRLAQDADVDAIVSNLKTSLSLALRTFYPLAGRIRLAPGTDDRYELHYRPGHGVRFTVAEYDHDFDSLATDEGARDVARLAPLLPPMPSAGGALLALQATLLSGGGLAVGVTVHHAACDGSASTHFLHTWAAFCRTGSTGQEESTLQQPVIDRSLVADPRGLYDVFYRARPTKDEMEFVKMSPDQRLATFVLSRGDLQRAKDAVAAEAAARGVATPPRCSSLVASLGLVWSCYHRAKKTDGGEEQQQPTCLLFPVDHRTRVKPPLPDKYLGNCVGPAFAIASKADLTRPGAGGLFAACAAVAAAIQEAVSEIGTPGVETWMERIREVGKTGALSMAGSPRFRVYELDFGFGAPGKVDIVSVARTGAVAVAESRNGDGGMEVGISLRPDGMERFRACFTDAMAWLRGTGAGDQ